MAVSLTPGGHPPRLPELQIALISVARNLNHQLKIQWCMSRNRYMFWCVKQIQLILLY